jgi:hypothetical protein
MSGPPEVSEFETYLLRVILQSLTRDGAVTGEVSLTFEVKPTNKTLIIAGSIRAMSCDSLGLHRATSDPSPHCDALGVLCASSSNVPDRDLRLA